MSHRYSTKQGRVIQENDQDRFERFMDVYEKQKKQIAQLKEQFIQLRDHYHTEKKDVMYEHLLLRKKIAAAQKKREQLSQQLYSLNEGRQNSEREQMADEIIERIWTILTDYRRELTICHDFEDVHFEIENMVPAPPTPDLPASLKTPSVDEDSIASRTRARNKNSRVYYGEPTMREFIAPNSPYIFTLEDERTPRIRNTPRSKRSY